MDTNGTEQHGAIETRDLEFETLYNYDQNTDYQAELDQYNRHIDAGQQDAARDLLKRHGGVISLIGKIEYQRRHPQAPM